MIMSYYAAYMTTCHNLHKLVLYELKGHNIYSLNKVYGFGKGISMVRYISAHNIAYKLSLWL